MRVVYILNIVDYDDCRILGVFATEKLAHDEESRLVTAGKYSAYVLGVEEWEVQSQGIEIRETPS